MVTKVTYMFLKSTLTFQEGTHVSTIRLYVSIYIYICSPKRHLGAFWDYIVDFCFNKAHKFYCLRIYVVRSLSKPCANILWQTSLHFAEKMNGRIKCGCQCVGLQWILLALLMDRDAHKGNRRSGKQAAVMDGERESLAVWVITWILGVGQAQVGAALGWTDASPKRNHRISST